ncbi:MAG TPA: hypothetical protein VER76_06810 [Pyrinomonadaceae bacterium]|nr:hypothetical protein [Pyrinomonadaceae bacterium]
MFSSKLKIIVVLALALSFASLTAAQEAASASPQPTQQPDNHVTHTNFKNRVFELKHRAPDTLYSVVKLLMSGHKGAEMSFNRNFRTLTVRDFSENLASIEEALKRLDTPETARPEIEFRMHVLIASNAAGGTNQYPADLRDAVGQLQTTLNFKSYYLLTSIIQRAKDRPDYAPGIIQGEGVAQIELPGETARRDFNYHFQANSLMLNTSAAGVTTVQLGNFRFRLDGGDIGGRAVISSDVGVRDGEKVVVGTAGLRDKALILVLSAKLIK